MVTDVSKKSVVVIGNFDGVHQGHRAVLREAQKLADLPVIVITFWPHPLSVLAPEKAPKLLTDLPSRIQLLKQAGADQIRIVHFTEEFASWSPAEFVSQIIRPLNPKTVVVGDNFRFGAENIGGLTELKTLADGDFEVVGINLLKEEESITCSTLIRQALEIGDVEKAAVHLGRNFRFSGLVVVGDQRGRDLGFPTANMLVPKELAVPADGVYAGWLTRLDDPDAEPMAAAISVGTNPTFDGIQQRVETYVIGRNDLELYGVSVGVDFVQLLRGQVKFATVNELITQMRNDVAKAKKILLG